MLKKASEKKLLSLLARAEEESKKGDVLKSIQYYRQVLCVDPQNRSGLEALAQLLEQTGEFKKAEMFWRRQIEVFGVNSYLLFSLGKNLLNQEQRIEAAALLQQVLTGRPDSGETHGILGNCLGGIEGEEKKALFHLRKAVDLCPDNPYIHGFLSFALLKQGFWADGFKEYEWRKNRPDSRHIYEPFEKFLPWQGEYFSGKKLLVYYEQGFGDTLQFVRLLPKVKRRGGSITLYVQPPLYKLLQNIEGVDEVVTEMPNRHFDYAVPLLSLPHLLGVTFPEARMKRPYLQATHKKKSLWKELVKSGKIKVGLVWSGNSYTNAIKNRSCSLCDMEPLLAVEGISFYSLQLNCSEEEKKMMNKKKIVDVSEKINDFSDTAECINELDLIISIDTAIIHLAGAMGKKVWVALPKQCEWRWQAGISKTDWYPSMHLFRQEKEGEWSYVFKKMADEIQELLILKKNVLHSEEKMKLSICMMIKNEAKYLERCLKSLEPLKKAVDAEIIVVDTGSDDGSIEIAQKYADQFYQHPWQNNFAEMRNKTIGYAKGEWVFIIDGDEILERPENMIMFLNHESEKNYNAATIHVKNYTSSEDAQAFSLLTSVRLFRKTPEFSYEGAVHNQPIFKGVICPIPVVCLHHFGYISDDIELMERKFLRTTSILKAELEKDQRNIYYWYQLSVSYGMHKDFTEAEQAIQKAYAICLEDKIDMKKNMYIYTTMAMLYAIKKDYEKVEKICLEALAIKDIFVDLYYNLAEAQANLGKNEDAIKSYEKYLEMMEHYAELEKDSSVIDYTVGQKDGAVYNLAQLFIRQEKYSEALELAKQIRLAKILPDAYRMIIFLFVVLKEEQELENYMASLESESDRLLFQDKLEAFKNEHGDDYKVKLSKIFAEGTNLYAFYNQVSLLLSGVATTKKITAIANQIYKIDFSQLPPFYGDLLYFLLKQKKSLLKVRFSADDNEMFQENRFNTYFGYLLNVHDDLNEVILEYLKKKPTGKTLKELQINKALSRYLLLMHKSDEDSHFYALKRYLEEGAKLVKNIYPENVVEDEQIVDIDNEEEILFVYFSLAEKQKKKGDKKKYLSYLKKIDMAFPWMKKNTLLLQNQESI